jgi:thiamine biosynthesis lipoprotein
MDARVMETGLMDDRRFHALGTVAHVIAESRAHVDRAGALLAELEDRWSRFRPHSDVSRANRTAGTPCPVHPDTVDLVERACRYWETTDGLFDPTVHDALVDAGYDRSFEAIESGERRSHSTRLEARPTPGAAAIVTDRRASTIALPRGVRLDLGGIGKGRAVDLVATALADAGSNHVLVNLGGDLRVVGGRPGGDPWRIDVEDPLEPHRPVARILLCDGAVATSTTARRRWSRGGRIHHHLIDPRTGAPADTSLVAVTVVTADAVDADVLAKASLVAGPGAGFDLLARWGVAALAFDAEAGWMATPSMASYLDASVSVTTEAVATEAVTTDARTSTAGARA